MKAALLAGLALALAAGCAAPTSSPRPAGPLVLLTADPGSGGRYLGSASCRACHPRAYELWRATGHAAAYAGLPAGERHRPQCLRCHVTGYGDPLGYGHGGGDDLAAVGCEACHGPGSDHARSAYPGLVPTATGGECPPCEANRICRLCHTPERSAGFDLARDLARISCTRDGR